MRIICHGKHMEVTEALKRYTELKMRRIVTIAPIEEAIVTFAVSGHKHDTQKVEVLLRMKGATIHGEERTADMYAAVDAITDKLLRKLRKRKEKMRGRLRGVGLGALALDAPTAEETA